MRSGKELGLDKDSTTAVYEEFNAGEREQVSTRKKNGRHNAFNALPKLACLKSCSF
jgi:hypothetical protein